MHLQAWLRQHGSHLTALAARLLQKNPSDGSAFEYPDVRLHLPALPQLTSLELWGLQPAFGSSLSQQSSAGVSGTAEASSHVPAIMLPNLKDLRWFWCSISNPISITGLTQLRGLTSLRIAGHKLKLLIAAPAVSAGTGISTSQALMDAVPTLVQHLPHLAQLSLIYIDAGRQRMVAPSSIAAAPSSLTSLAWRSSQPRTCLNPMVDRGSFAHLVLLRHLILCTAAFTPTALASLPHLVSLDLSSCRLLPACTASLSSQPDTAAAAGEQAAVFFDTLHGMQDLQQLVLWNLQCRDGSLACAAVQPRQLSALTASNQLIILEIGADEQAPLPSAAVPYMFPAGRQLSALQTLFIGCDDLAPCPCVHAGD